ncbi:WD40 repeat domain-containing protein [Streptomyces sp. NPDC013172]|uniref:WD40 repeat domain-containing protein n=1 Tax=Streptomyces sp. NPDC013172 TaxID=3155009 RepID=UPI003411028A
MGRPERPVDPDDGPVPRFAHELRALRRAAGSPSYRTMAKHTGLSVTALSRAASGERLASAAVVRAYARACGADPDEWERRWEAVAEEARPASAQDGDSPYQGLARFEYADRDRFFGRERLVEDALTLAVEHRFAVLVGTSGSGKSSLLRAGLLPRLEARGTEFRLITPGRRPAATHERLLDPPPDGPERFVVVDQFEEIFTLCRDRADRWRFVDRLLAAREPAGRLRVVVAVGGSFHSLCTAHAGLAEALRTTALTVRPMNRAELQEAVVRPATAAGLRVERELTARIIEEAADQPGALPMLSHALRETWRRRRSGVLTLTAYEAAGGIHGAIAAAAEEVYGGLSPAQAATARRLLLALIEPGTGTADTRRPVSRADLREWPDPEVPEVLQRLARARLVTLGQESIELAHEALITRWPRLQAWIDAHRERLAEHRRLSEAARIWQERRHDSGNLYRGAQLAVADVLFGRGVNDHDLTGRERAFLSASRVARRMEGWTAGRIRSRTRGLAVALSVVLAALLVAGQLAWQRGNAADLERLRAGALQAAALAGRTQSTDPRTAALLSVAAWRLAPSSVSRAALLSALAEPEDDVFTGPVPGESGGAFLADSGRTLLVAGAGSWSTWDVTGHRRTGSGTLPDAQVAAADPAGRTVLLADPGGWRLWRLPGATGRRAPAGGHVLGFGADGHSYVVREAGAGPGVRLRAVDDGSTLFRTAAVDAYPVPSPDDRLVAVCRPGRSLELRDTARGAVRHGGWQGLRTPDCSSGTVALGAGGTRLAAASATGAGVWDTTTGRRLADLTGSGLQHLAFTADGASLAAAGPDGVTVWRISAPGIPVLRQPVPGGPVTDLAWDVDGSVLRYLAGSSVHTLDLSTVLTAPWRARPLDAVLLSPDGRLLAAVERTATGYRLRLARTRTGRTIAVLPFSTRSLGTSRVLLAFSPDSRAVAYGAAVAARVAPSAGGSRGAVSEGGSSGAPSAGGASGAVSGGAASGAVGRAAPAAGVDGATPGAGRSGSVPTARFTVRDTLPGGHAGTSFEVTGPAAATARAIALTPKGRQLLVGWVGPAGTVVPQMWDTVRRTRAAGRDVGEAAVRAALSSGFSGRTAVPPDGPNPRTPLTEGRGSYDLALSRDGRLLATGGAYGTVTVSDIGRSDGPVAVVPGPPDTTGCALCARITALAFSRDATTLAVAYGSGALRLWDLALDRPLGGSPTTPGDVIDSLAFGPDGYLYAAGPHVPVQAYAVGPAQVAARLCARADGTLTAAQWRRYLPDVPYRRVCAGPDPEEAGTGAPTALAPPSRTPPAATASPAAAALTPSPRPDRRPRSPHGPGRQHPNPHRTATDPPPTGRAPEHRPRAHRPDTRPTTHGRAHPDHPVGHRATAG